MTPLERLEQYVGGWDETLGVSWHNHNEAVEALAEVKKERERMLDALLNSQGCRTCDMCPHCNHLAHGAAADIGHYEGCELAEVIDLVRGKEES